MQGFHKNEALQKISYIQRDINLALMSKPEGHDGEEETVKGTWPEKEPILICVTPASVTLNHFSSISVSYKVISLVL